MKNLYLLTEDDNDDLFYERCLEELTGYSFQLVSYRSRKRSGISDVRRTSKHLLQIIKNTGTTANACFVIVVDNDRCPEHPHHNRLPGLSQREQKQTCRFCELQKTIHDVLGEDKSLWPAKGAIAVPVQMLESWLLLICNPELKDENLPIFPEQKKPNAQQYYSRKKMPEQLKDLCKIEQSLLNLNETGEFYFHCADIINPDELAARSPSFALFKEQIDEWQKQYNDSKQG